MTSRHTIYLIDGSAYVYRAFHAIRSLANSSGLPTNAVFGFTRMLMKLMEDRSPSHVGLFFDAKGPTFRHERYAEYKANRPPMPEDMVTQLPYIHQVATGFRIPAIEIEGFEADDLIGAVARAAERDGFDVVIVTGDKDFVQLLSDRVSIWDPMKDRTLLCADFREANGIEPGQMVDAMGLSGDTSDNIPGVPGIGPKTALTLIRTFGSIDGLYEQVATLKGKKKQYENLITFRDQAYLSRDLAAIRTDAPISWKADRFKTKPPDRKALADLFGQLEFRELRQRFSDGSPAPEKTYRVVLDDEALQGLISILGDAELISVDTETTSRNPLKAKLVGLSFSVAPHEAWYIPVGHRYLGAPSQLNQNRVLQSLRPILEDPTRPKVGQNIKYDWMVLSRHGVALEGVVFDTMVASYLLNPSKRSHGLDQIALDYLNHKTIPYEEVAGKKQGFDTVSVEDAVPYACEDADITLQARHILAERLEKIGLTELLETVEMPLIPVLMKMERLGICVDIDRLRKLSLSFESQLESLEAGIHSLAGETFNIKSSQQLGRILFEKLGLPTQKKTKKKTGYSTDVDVLTALADLHELPALVLRHRTLAKLKSTYADALIEIADTGTRRVHTSFNQTVTATGRLSSSEPNLQNIPIRTEEGLEIRRAFVPQDGWQLLSADYSQVELRILAHCSEDVLLIDAFRSGEDIHARTASEIFQVDANDVTPELRRHAKVINFGIIYGMGAYSLSQDLGISQPMAKTYIDSYFAHYQGVKRFIDQTIDAARETRRTSTLLGRIRLLPDIASSNINVRRFAERTAVNTPIQGTAADLIKLAMIQVDLALSSGGFKAAMLLSVHDEIVLEAPPEELESVGEAVRTTMESVWKLRVPLKVNIAWGNNWAEAH
ncbi:MAG: DNA polymerase I [Desulfobacterales bacterium]|jgi:DNA polymerase-1